VAEPGGTLGSSTVWKLNKDGNGYAVLADFEAGTGSPDTTYGPVLNGWRFRVRVGAIAMVYSRRAVHQKSDERIQVHSVQRPPIEMDV
jgi:hypothetical protein